LEVDMWVSVWLRLDAPRRDPYGLRLWGAPENYFSDTPAEMA